MIFNYVLGIQEIDKEKVKINYREAIRAIILKDNEILMVHNIKGDYKFPGGGVNKEESYEQTLYREVEEETGYILNKVKELIGVVVERQLDDYEENAVFEMISSYYLCEISDAKTIQQLDDYEAELDFKPVWVPLDKAIEVNEEILKKATKDKNSWVNRETNVLKSLKEYNSN